MTRGFLFRDPPEGESNTGAGNETRTRDLNLGKVALYQLSYSRIVVNCLFVNLQSSAKTMTIHFFWPC